MTCLVKLVAPRWERRPDGGKSFLGWPLPPGDNWLVQSPDESVKTTRLVENALWFDSGDAAAVHPEVVRVGAHYEVEMVELLL